jgi:hypothetical protein
MRTNRKVAILTYYHHPCNHPVLTNIFAKELAKTNAVVWFLQGDVSRGKVQRWQNSTVFLKKKIYSKNIVSKVVNKTRGACIV